MQKGRESGCPPTDRFFFYLKAYLRNTTKRLSLQMNQNFSEELLGKGEQTSQIGNNISLLSDT